VKCPCGANCACTPEKKCNPACTCADQKKTCGCLLTCPCGDGCQCKPEQKCDPSCICTCAEAKRTCGCVVTCLCGDGCTCTPEQKCNPACTCADPREGHCPCGPHCHCTPLTCPCRTGARCTCHDWVNLLSQTIMVLWAVSVELEAEFNDLLGFHMPTIGPSDGIHPRTATHSSCSAWHWWPMIGL
jgi:hypothetical protein